MNGNYQIETPKKFFFCKICKKYFEAEYDFGSVCPIHNSDSDISRTYGKRKASYCNMSYSDLLNNGVNMKH